MRPTSNYLKREILIPVTQAIMAESQIQSLYRASYAVLLVQSLYKASYAEFLIQHGIWHLVEYIGSRISKATY